MAPDSSAKPLTENRIYTYGLDPLVKIDGVLKKRKIDLSYTMGIQWDTTVTSKWSFIDTAGWSEQSRSGNGSMNITLTNVWSGGYKINGKKGKTLKLFKGRVVEIKGDTRISVRVDTKKIKHRKVDQSQPDDIDPSKPKTTSWDDSFLNISPKVEYDFTKNISFTLFYNLVNSIVDPEKRKNHSGELASEVTINF
jgi:hypothetical protein